MSLITAFGQMRISGPVEEVQIGKTKVILLGTAHVSAASVADVEELVEIEKPEVIAIELCESRFQSLKEETAWRKLDIVQVIRQKKLLLLMSSIILTIFQKKIGDKTGVKPGDEMRKGLALAEATGANFELIDRNIQITLRRAWQSFSYFQKIGMVNELIVSIFTKTETTSEEIEQLKKKDALEELLQTLPPQFHKVREILLDERDQYMAEKIQKIAEDKKPKKMLVVIGAAHLQGLTKYLKKSVRFSCEELTRLKSGSQLWGKLKLILPPAILLGAIFYFTDNRTVDGITESLLTWSIIKIGITSFFLLPFFPHPLTFLLSVSVAPISTFNPILKPGWVAALTEAKFRKPRVIDFENLAIDSVSIKKIWKNRVFRIFLLFFLPQLGSSIATFIALAII